jgi:hypothetical protein
MTSMQVVAAQPLCLRQAAIDLLRFDMGLCKLCAAHAETQHTVLKICTYKVLAVSLHRNPLHGNPHMIGPCHIKH